MWQLKCGWVIQILLEEGYTVFQIAKRLNAKVEDVEKVIVTHQ